ncbi:MAG TPA: tetratricopeptide repeat protein, partial [Candidatus Polarisedimenticolia bacterium]|nr:tetratricopeptide repeat protein [Candidatus Polarisedimenticolia bacterium]
EAIAALRQAQTLEKGNPWHPVTIGGIFLDQDNLVQARREFDRALELDADFLEAYLAYAGLLRRECDFTAAIEMIEKGLRRDVDDAPTLAQLREKKEKLESEAALAAEIQARLDAGPRTAADLSALADLKASVGDFESSVRLLQEAGETPEGDVAPADAGPARLERLGYGALRAGMYAEAAEAYARVAQLEPGRAEILINLGLARMGLGDRDGAEESLREASRLRPGDPTPFACLGNLYATSGRRDRAVASLDTALTLMAEGAEERQRVERLLRHLKSPGAQGS